MGNLLWFRRKPEPVAEEWRAEVAALRDEVAELRRLARMQDARLERFRDFADEAKFEQKLNETWNNLAHLGSRLRIVEDTVPALGVILHVAQRMQPIITDAVNALKDRK